MKKICLSLITTITGALFINFAAFAAETNFPPAIGYIGNEKVAHVTVNDQHVITIKAASSQESPLEQTKKIALTLNKLLFEKKLRPDLIVPGIKDRNYIAHIDNQVIFSVNQKIARAAKSHKNLLTLNWINKLRRALGAKTFDHQVSRGLSTYSKQVQYGYSSWYGPYFHGRLTANGEIYNMYDYTAAHRDLPLGTLALVTNLDTSRSILVRINDRGPYAKTHRRILDLSRNAFDALAPLGKGIIRIRLDVLELGDNQYYHHNY